MTKRLQAMRVAKYADGFDKVVCHSDCLEEPFHWKKPRMIFVCSMSDLFHNAVPDKFLDLVFDTIEKTPQHTYQILTKRTQRMAAHWIDSVHLWPQNAWAGVTVENQEMADKRIPDLLRVNASVRFVSCEPLLGPIDFFKIPRPDDGYFCWRGEIGAIGSKDEPDDYVWANKTGISQIIVGGESGPGARPMQAQWVRDIRDQCIASGVPFFFKQWGDRTRFDRMDTEAVQAGCNLRQKNGGCVLDGREWKEFPK